MNTLSIKIKALIAFMVAIFFVASVSLIVVIYKSNQLGQTQTKDESELILEMNKNELKAYTMMAEKAINTFYEASSSEANIAQKIKADAMSLKKTLDDVYQNNKDKLSQAELRTMLLGLSMVTAITMTLVTFMPTIQKASTLCTPSTRHLSVKILLI